MAHSLLKKIATQRLLLICLPHLYTAATLPWEKLIHGFVNACCNTYGQLDNDFVKTGYFLVCAMAMCNSG